MTYGPTLPVSIEEHTKRYRGEGESFEEAMTRIASALKDNDHHFRELRDSLLEMRFLPAGRVQAAVGAPRLVTPYNCFVMDTIPDSMRGIMRVVGEAADTMRMGGGVGYDFSTLRPRDARIVSLDSRSSGPVSFMGVFDALCQTISSAGHRRGAQMGVLRVDHPDIEEFVRAKQNGTDLTNFNMSVGVTDAFMKAVEAGEQFDLTFGGSVYKRIDAVSLWEEIMRSTWDWGEPGVLFLDTANRLNPLWYCETLTATNPCAEQWLPPYGACLLGSFNLVKYLKKNFSALHQGNIRLSPYSFDFELFKHDICLAVTALDNVIDNAVYPLEQQRVEAISKRRMGLGITGAANCIEAMGHAYGSSGFVTVLQQILATLRNTAYMASSELSARKGAFPMYRQEAYAYGPYIHALPEDVWDAIIRHGIRNSHLTSIAPTGTISLCADNVSSGIEPVFRHEYDRIIQSPEGPRTERVTDYGYRELGIKGRTADECSIDDHLDVLEVSSLMIDSSVSKTCNVPHDMAWDDFKDIYVRAWKGGAKGITTFRSGGKRAGVLTEMPPTEEPEGAACFIDSETGRKSCE